MEEVMSYTCSNCCLPGQGIDQSHCVSCNYNGGIFQDMLREACLKEPPLLKRGTAEDLFIEMFDEDSLHANCPFDIAALRFWVLVRTGSMATVEAISVIYNHSFGPDI